MTSVRLCSVAIGVLGLVGPCVLAAQTQASIGVATGEVRFQGQPANGALVVTPSVQNTSAILRVWTAGHFALVNTGATRSTLQSARRRQRQPAYPWAGSDNQSTARAITFVAAMMSATEQYSSG